jgi:hypothetical protein
MSLLNQPSPLLSADVDSMIDTIMIPLVPGKIVFLHPMEQYNASTAAVDARQECPCGVAEGASRHHQATTASQHKRRSDAGAVHTQLAGDVASEAFPSGTGVIDCVAFLLSSCHRWSRM